MSFLRRSLLGAREEDSTETPTELRSQWANPSDILSLLLLIGSDVVQRALAQQVGHRPFWLWLPVPTPVVFSFGWVAYGFTALSSAVGENRLLPPPDCPCVVISTQEGYTRSNESWILGRLVRDFERKLMTEDAKSKLDVVLEKITTEKNLKTKAKKGGLCVSIFRASENKVAGVPTKDLWWYSGYAVAIIQWGIAAIPWGLYGQWEIFVIVVCGTLLAFVTGSLPQWRNERYACREDSDKTFVLTRGNGAQHAIVIRGDGYSLDLEDLASVTEDASARYLTRYIFGLFALLWVALLISVSGIKDNTWFLIAVGGLGMLHTVFIAGAPRNPSAFGIHLEPVDCVAESKVMPALEKTEQKFPGVGRSMIPIFFTGELWPEEKLRWDEYRKTEEEEKEAKKKEKKAKKKQKENQTVIETQVSARNTDNSGSSEGQNGQRTPEHVV